jgi:hypothetical protein
LQEKNNAAVASRILDEISDPGAIQDIRLAIESMAQSTIANRSMHFSDFANIMQLIDMDFDLLYRMYVGKNVLNFFRQDHGYKEGSYTKVWQGREDNEHLAELLSQLDSESASFKDEVYQGLQARYTG